MALDREVRLLLDKGALEEAPLTPGFYSHLFVVPKATGGFRPILDLSHLNRYVITTRFRMETVRTVMSAIRSHDWMTAIDLKDAYFQVPVHPDSRRFLRFVWKGLHYQFKVLCFGLSTAPQVFSRMMGPVSAVSHQRGIRLLRYLDDWLLLSRSREGALEATEFLLDLCASLGIQINWDKSSLVPSQSRTYLGMEIRSTLLKVFPTRERLGNLCRQVESFLSVHSPPARDWLILLGHMSSLIHLIPGARRRMRGLQVHLSRSWDRRSQSDRFPVPWSAGLLEDLRWWLSSPALRVGQSLELVSPDVSLFSDASTLGWGASVLQASVSGLWTPQERSLHINLLELRAIRLGLSHFAKDFRGKAVAVRSDNATALAGLVQGF